MNGYLVDTNVISELAKRQPEEAVAQWLNGADASRLFISVLTLGEIRKGTAFLEPSRRRASLEEWLEVRLMDWFGDRILPIDRDVADQWGRFIAAAALSGRAIPILDSLLIATALYHGLTLVTRNVKHLEGAGFPIFNPWTIQ